MGRRPLFRPRVATAEDASVYQTLVDTYALDANDATRRRVVADFGSFAATNGLTDRPCTCLKLWLGACHRDGLAWSTIDTYSGYITKATLPVLALGDRQEWLSIRAVIRAVHADSDTKAAPTVCRDHLIRILASPSLSLRVRQAIAAIAFTGCRLADARRWRRKQVFFGTRALKVEVHLSKNRRRRSKRRTIRIMDCEELLGLTMDPSLPGLQYGDADERPLSGVTVGMVNTQLSRTCAILHLPRYTTYSFRKFFIQQVIKWFEYDWSQIVNLTLHTHASMLWPRITTLYSRRTRSTIDVALYWCGLSIKSSIARNTYRRLRCAPVFRLFSSSGVVYPLNPALPETHAGGYGVHRFSVSSLLLVCFIH